MATWKVIVPTNYTSWELARRMARNAEQAWGMTVKRSLAQRAIVKADPHMSFERLVRAEAFVQWHEQIQAQWEFRVWCLNHKVGYTVSVFISSHGPEPLLPSYR